VHAHGRRVHRFPFDRLLRGYPLDQINNAERDSANGTTIKPILLPGGCGAATVRSG
jgi:aryl-alcohol dehydrogenase